MTLLHEQSSSADELKSRLVATIRRVRKQVEHLNGRLNEMERLVHGLAKPSRSVRRRREEELPFYAMVTVIGGRGIPKEVTGKKGIVLGRAQERSGEWIYTVLIEPTNETCVLSRPALRFRGKIASRNDIYSGASVRVAVDKLGAGKVVESASRKRLK